MTIFKHYISSRGKPLLSTNEFKIYKSLPKCGFPPTHPSFSHLFRTEEKWQVRVQDRLESFLDAYFGETVTVPKLLKAIQSTDAQQVKSKFKQREEKLLEFCRSIYDISEDLLKTIESGDKIRPEVLGEFKQNFVVFEEILYNGQRKQSNGKSKVSLENGIASSSQSEANEGFYEPYLRNTISSIGTEGVVDEGINLRLKVIDFNLLDVDG